MRPTRPDATIRSLLLLSLLISSAALLRDCLERPHFLNYLLPKVLFGHVYVIPVLQVQPETRILPKVPTETQSQFRGDRALSAHNMTNAHGSHGDILRQAALGQPQLFQ